MKSLGFRIVFRLVTLASPRRKLGVGIRICSVSVSVKNAYKVTILTCLLPKVHHIGR